VSQRPFQRPLTLVTDLEPLAEARGWNYHVHLPGERRFVTGSHALAVDVTALALDGHSLVAHHYLKGLHTSEDILDYYYGRLYAVTKEQLVSVFTCDIPDTKLVGWPGAVVTEENELLIQSTTHPSQSALKMEIALYNSMPYDSAPPGRYISLQGYACEIYGHWLVDALPRLMIDFPLDPSLIVLIPARSHNFHYETLSLLGIPAERIFTPRKRVVHIPDLHLCVTSEGTVRPHITLIHRLAAALRASAGVAEPVHQRRLYVSRANQKRAIVNESELLPILERFSFEIVTPESLSVVEQVRLFSQASVIVGAFGSGMLNSIFAKPGALVLEIFNRDRWDMHHHRLLSLLGHQHWHCFAENINEAWDTYVDPKKFEKCLDYALSQ